jgi:polysaccharide export outer membrane protein
MKTSIIRTLAIFVCLFTFAAASFAAPPQPQKNEPAQAPPPDYVVGPEDVLDISVWKNTDLSRVVIVRPDGMISLPLVGDIKAAGLSPEQLKSAVEKKLREYSETAVVSVIVQAVNSYKVFVLGEVRTPGVQVYKANATVLQAITLAGGFTEYASKNKIVLIRKKKDGSEEKTRLRFKDLVSIDENDNKNMVLKPGDTIFVP